MARRGRRGLNDDDLAVWSQVARSARPMREPDAPRAPLAAPPEPAFPPTSRAPEPLPIQASVQVPVDFRVGQAARAKPRTATAVTRHLSPSPAERLHAQPLRMDHKTHRKMSRGKLAPEARIDLHGMTLAVAKTALTGFILRCSGSGRRLVLVITGKGKGDHGPLPTRSGALRHEVPHWLDLPPLSHVVLQVVPAHLRHGGGGAYYVYLRRAG